MRPPRDQLGTTSLQGNPAYPRDQRVPTIVTGIGLHVLGMLDEVTTVCTRSGTTFMRFEICDPFQIDS